MHPGQTTNGWLLETSAWRFLRMTPSSGRNGHVGCLGPGVLTIPKSISNALCPSPVRYTPESRVGSRRFDPRPG